VLFVLELQVSIGLWAGVHLFTCFIVPPQFGVQSHIPSFMAPFKLGHHVSKKLQTSNKTNDGTSYEFHNVSDTPPGRNMQHAHKFPKHLRNQASFLAPGG